MTKTRTGHLLFAIILTVIGAVGSIHASYADTDEPGLTFFRIGTGPTATASYAFGTAISAGISKPPGSLACDLSGLCGVPGLIAVAQTQTDARASLDAIENGTLESVLVPADIAYQAYTGSGLAKGKSRSRNLRVIANLIGLSVHIVVRDGRNIETISDLKGHAVSIGTAGSSMHDVARTILRVHGIKSDDIDVVELSPGPAADAMMAGKIDAFFALTSSPDSVVEAVGQALPIKLLPIEGYPLQQLHSLYPFIASATIPAGHYDLAEPVSSIALSVKWITRDEIPGDLIEAITRAFWEGNVRKLYKRNNPRSLFADLGFATLTGGIPLHDGAKRYYATLGMKENIPGKVGDGS